MPYRQADTISMAPSVFARQHEGGELARAGRRREPSVTASASQAVSAASSSATDTPSAEGTGRMADARIPSLNLGALHDGMCSQSNASMGANFKSGSRTARMAPRGGLLDSSRAGGGSP